MTDFYKGIPKAVRIGCYTYRVEVGSVHEHLNSFGWNSMEHRVISIAPGLRGEQLANTFLHECLHGIHWVYGLLTPPTDPSMPSMLPDEEAFTTYGVNGLCAFWQDNPEAMKWWLKALTSKE